MSEDPGLSPSSLIITFAFTLYQPLCVQAFPLHWFTNSHGHPDRQAGEIVHH